MGLHNFTFHLHVLNPLWQLHLKHYIYNILVNVATYLSDLRQVEARVKLGSRVCNITYSLSELKCTLSRSVSPVS